MLGDLPQAAQNAGQLIRFVLVILFATLILAPVPAWAQPVPRIQNIAPISGAANTATTIGITGINLGSSSSDLQKIEYLRSGQSAPTPCQSVTWLKSGGSVSFFQEIDALCLTNADIDAGETVSFRATTASGGVGPFSSVIFSAVPIITGITPDSGPVSGGTLVTISGKGLTGATSVTFDACPNPVVPQFVSNAVITLTTPSGCRASVSGLFATSKLFHVETPNGTANSEYSLYDIYSNVGLVSIFFDFQQNPTPLTIGSVTPTNGKIAGGTPISIIGTGFTGASAVKIGDATVALASGLTPPNYVQNDNDIVITTPAGTKAGDAPITVTVGSNSVTKSGVFSYLAVPTITNVSLTNGPAGTKPQGSIAGGTSITIAGTGFSGFEGTPIVKIGATTLVNVSVNVDGTQITFTTPAGQAGAVSISVATPGGTATLDKAFTYVAPPTITSVSPSAGPQAGGQSVKIIGSAFTGATDVSIGGVSESVFNPSDTRNTDTTLFVTTPKGQAGDAPIVVTTKTGTVTNTLTKTGVYTYLPVPSILKVSPRQASTAGGTQITIAGTFGALPVGTTDVTIGGASATGIISSSGPAGSTDSDTISVIVPKAPGPAGTTAIVVTTLGGQATLINALTYVDPPTITNVKPASGPYVGGTPITITGTGFTSDTMVSIKGTPATVTFVSDKTINATMPGGVAGAATVLVKAPIGSATSTFTYVGPPTITKVTPTAGAAGIAVPVTLTGTNLTVESGRTIVTYGPKGIGSTCTVSVPIVGTSLTCTTQNDLIDGTSYSFIVTVDGQQSPASTMTLKGLKATKISPFNGTLSFTAPVTVNPPTTGTTGTGTTSGNVAATGTVDVSAPYQLYYEPLQTSDGATDWVLKGDVGYTHPQDGTKPAVSGAFKLRNPLMFSVPLPDVAFGATIAHLKATFSLDVVGAWSGTFSGTPGNNTFTVSGTWSATPKGTETVSADVPLPISLPGPQELKSTTPSVGQFKIDLPLDIATGEIPIMKSTFDGSINFSYLDQNNVPQSMAIRFSFTGTNEVTPSAPPSSTSN